MKRRDPKKSVATKPAERFVLPSAATRRFKKILGKGGFIHKITIHYSIPSEFGHVYGEESALFNKEVKGIEIK